MEISNLGESLNILDIQKNMRKSRNGKIKTKTVGKSNNILIITISVLIILTIYGFLTLDYGGIKFWDAINGTIVNLKTMFLNAKLSHFTFDKALYQLGITFALAFLTTIIGAFFALFLGLFAATNLSNKVVSNIIKAFVSFIRAIPTVLWVLIFAISAGLGSVAAVIGLTFHTMGYLIKAYSESFEEIDEGVLEALKASGANWWQIVFQAILPSSATSLMAWTFMRFEINFTNAVAMGAAAGAGGIGFELFMSGSFYFDPSEVGFITLMILACAMILEFSSTRVKNKYIR